MGAGKGEHELTAPTTDHDADFAYRPVRRVYVVDTDGRRVVVNGHPDVVAYRRDTPTYGRNGAFELLLSVLRGRREVTR